MGRVCWVVATGGGGGYCMSAIWIDPLGCGISLHRHRVISILSDASPK